MSLKKVAKQLRKHTWGLLRRKVQRSRWYPLTFRSYWHCRLKGGQAAAGHPDNHMGAIPNRGAGIGHQMANWISGYWWARQFGLRFAHWSFTSPQWERFLGFGEDELGVEALVSDEGYRIVKLPPFREAKEEDLDLIRRIISSYDEGKVVFQLHANQPYKEHIGVMDDIRRKFHQAEARQSERVQYSPDCFSIAVHVRRGDIVQGQLEGNANHQLRWQDNDYFRTVLANVLADLRTPKPIEIFLFSQGQAEDFADFDGFENLRLCLDMSAEDSFLHMVKADLLITSKSSFSYKPALISEGIRVCPREFWCGYPKDDQWVLVEQDGSFPQQAILDACNNTEIAPDRVGTDCGREA